MRIAVIADIHGNLPALEAVADHILEQDVQRIVCLGDLAWKGPAPGECIRWVRARGLPCVLGNGDAYLAHAGGLSPTVPVPAAVLRGEDWTRSLPLFRWHLALMEPHDLSYLAALPMQFRLQAGGQRLLFAHGTPRSYLEGVRRAEVATQAAAVTDAEWLIIGHTHRQWQAEVDGVIVVNPGAVGFSLDGDPRASYAVIDTDRRVAALHRVLYDVEQAVALARQRQFCFDPDWYAEQLRGGMLVPMRLSERYSSPRQSGGQEQAATDPQA